MMFENKIINAENMVFIGKGKGPSASVEFRRRRWSIFNYDKRRYVVMAFSGMVIFLEHTKSRNQTQRNKNV